jgi:CBS domain-containing protein
MVEVPFNEIIDLLRGVVPFNELSLDVLNELPEKILIKTFPKGSLILEQDGAPGDYLFIIQTGAVEKTVKKNGMDVLLDYRTEGEFFGSASLIRNAGPSFSVRTYEDTVCLLLPKEVFGTLMQHHVGFHEHFAIRVSKLAFRLKKAQAGVFSPRESSDTVVFRSDGYLFRVTAGDLVKRKPVTCSPYHEAAFVAKLMAREGIGAVVVVDPRNRPIGIVTKSDMTHRILGSGKTGSEPVRTIMNAPIISVAPEEPCFNALVKMAGFNCHHICVVVGELLLGVISQHDLIALQGANPLGLINDIERQTTIQALAKSVGAMDSMAGDLLHAGVPTQDITSFISECNDRLTRRIIVLTEDALREEGLGSPPVPYCWLALGSEGRKEQTLRTDQDNAIVYTDPEAESDQEVRNYFHNLAQRVVSGLEICGFPLCKGNIMASNPNWCQPQTVWRRYFAEWITEASPEDLRNCSIFFDFRPLGGASSLAQKLRIFLNDYVQRNRAFLRHLTTNALFNGPPLGFLRTLVVEKTGIHKNELNLKMSGLVPVVDALRVLGLSEQITATNTLRRLELVRENHVLSQNVASDIKEAFSFIMLLRINHHLGQKEQNEEPSDYIDPKSLSKIQRRSLIEAFNVIRDLQGELKAGFPESI